jgi:hypothetical protein
MGFAWRYWSFRNSSAWPSDPSSSAPASPSGTTTASKRTDGHRLERRFGLEPIHASPARGPDQAHDGAPASTRGLRAASTERLEMPGAMRIATFMPRTLPSPARGERQGGDASTSAGSPWRGAAWPWERDADALGHLPGELVRDVAQHRDDALADRGHRHLRELEAEAADDVRLLVVGLAVPEERRLREVLGEFLRLAAHLVAFHRLRERTEARAARLEGAAAPERVGLVGDAPAMDRLAVEPSRWLLWACAIGALIGISWKLGPPSRESCVSKYEWMRPASNGSFEKSTPARGSGRRRHLLGLREEIVGVAVEDHRPIGVTGTSSSGTILVGSSTSKLNASASPR